MDCMRLLALINITGLLTDMETYILVPWPEVQQYMEEQWFYDEAVLATGAEEKVGCSAYFIAAHRILNFPFAM